MKNNKWILFLLVNVCSYQTFAQSFLKADTVLILDSVLAIVEKNNPMLKMYDQQVEAAENFSQMTKSWMPPTFSTGPWQSQYRDFNTGMWMFTGEQMIPNPSKQKANYKYMQGMIPVEQKGKEAKRNELFAMAKESYFSYAILKKKLALIIETDSTLNQIIELAELNFKYNKEKLNKIYKAQAELYELRNMTTMFEADIKMKIAELNTLMNRPPSTYFDVDTTISPKDFKFGMANDSTIAKSRSDILQLDATINLLKSKQAYEKSKRLPDFGISFSHMTPLTMMPNMFTAMGMITIPIAPWAAKEYKSSIKGITNSINAIELSKQAVINEASGMIEAIQINYRSGKEQVVNYELNILPAYEKSVSSSMAAYKQNTEDLIVVLDVIKMYQMAKLDYMEKVITLFKLQVAYEKQLEIR